MAKARAIRKPQPAPVWLFLRHLEAFSPPESFDAFVMHRPAFPAQAPAGYLPIDRQAATLFFQLISRRYERGPMIEGSNHAAKTLTNPYLEKSMATAPKIPERSPWHQRSVTSAASRSWTC